MNLTESLLRALEANGAGEIFGIPGDFALPYFRIIEESGILPLYTLSHEPGVGFAADAAARVRGTLGVAAVTYGAGALNMVNAIASAFAESRSSCSPAAWAENRAPSPAPSGEDARLAVQIRESPGPDPARRCRGRAGGNGAGACELSASFAAGLHRDSSRHGRGRLRSRTAA
jgi:hypothetical protein